MTKQMRNLNSVLETKLVDRSLNTIDIDGSFAGYASIFDAVDLGNETLAKGAFVKSLAAKGVSGVRMLFQHNPDEPIGQWLDIYEDSKGLFVKGQLNLDVARAREVHTLMRSGSIDGLSIGFKTVRSRREKGGTVRRILEADLWEISVVTFPMLPDARISQVKSCSNLPTKREFEHWLVRDAGLSRSQAKTVIVKGFASLMDARDAGHFNAKTKHDDTANLVQKMRQAARHIKI